jgi:hypothetical protein
MVWGLDILGAFPKAVGGYEWLYVSIDKFTKWPQVTLVIKANKGSALKFHGPGGPVRVSKLAHHRQLDIGIKLSFA